ncbi:MAG TPA: endonuclease V [Fibrobacteria bacterium]|nr:endonuclease V [Fibrobacteria bacterium]
MNLAMDVQYGSDRAAVAGILFQDWADDRPFEILTTVESSFGEYEPGAFYKRELPCLLALLQKCRYRLETIVVDGYVTLSDDKPGLGMHLHRALEGAVAVVGVAKTRYQGISADHEILRGASARPLFVTSMGCPLELAKERILSMHGEHRIPFLLGRADREARELAR